jgi:transcriptional regulator with XRE-family HTH domain
METITDRLNRRSLELNVSQADIIRATGAGRGTVSGWFSGANAPSAKYLESLAVALKTSTTWLLSGKDDDINSRTEPSIDLSPIATVGYAPAIAALIFSIS